MNQTTNLIKCALLLSCTFSLGLNCSEAETLKDHKISDVYSKHKAKTNEFSTDDKLVIPVSIKKINSAFSNTKGLSWLETISNNKVILIGETHYSQEIAQLKDKIIFKLNQLDHFPLVITENSYSISQFFNYYVHIKSDEQARLFLKELEKFTKFENDVTFINNIRKWNLNNPEKTISVGSTDLEWDYPNMCKNIIKPYFEKLGHGESHHFYEIIELCTGQENDFFTKIEPLLYEARKQGLIGDYPFITPGYIGRVIENFSDTNNALRYSFDFYRQKSILKKIKSDGYFGNYFNNQKVIIYGGGNHTKSKFNYPDGGNFLSEGSYLNHTFLPTKGRVYSIMLKGLSFSLGPNKDISLDGRALGQQYKKIFNQLQKAYQAQLLLPENYYFLYGERSEFEKYIFYQSYKNNLSAVYIPELNDRLQSMLPATETTTRNDYDMVIYFPFTTLVQIKK